MRALVFDERHERETTRRLVGGFMFVDQASSDRFNL